MSLKNITVNGRKLDEFLKSNESIQEEIDRKKLFKEQTEEIRLGRHVKAKFRERIEANGEVKILGIREVNKANYEKYLLRSLKDEKILDSLTIILISYPKKSVFTTQNIADIIDDFAEENDIKLLRSTNHSLRGRLGLLRKSELSDFMYFLERNTPKNKTNVMKYGIKDDALEALSIDDALELAHTRKKAFKDKSVLLNPDRSRQKPSKPKTEKDVDAFEKMRATPLTEKIEEEKVIDSNKNQIVEKQEDTSLIANVIEQIKALKSDESAVFVIKGDIHVHINITR